MWTVSQDVCKGDAHLETQRKQWDGRSHLIENYARRLSHEGIDYATTDNAFVCIAGFARAQELADTFKFELLHRHLDRYARLCCPILEVFGQTYHWSIMQAEYSTDLVFKSEQILRSLNQQLAREAVLSVKAE